MPGLIIEAYDINKEIVFKFAGFHTIKDGTEVIEVPTKGIRTTVKEYEEMKNAFRQDMAGSINAMTEGRAGIVNTPGSKAPNRTTTNHIELYIR